MPCASLRSFGAFLHIFCLVLAVSATGGCSSQGAATGANGGGGQAGSSSGAAGAAPIGGATAGSNAMGGAGVSGSSQGGMSGSGGTDSAGAAMGGSGGMGGMTGGVVPPFPPNADFPYQITNYDEPYRGQVHFTAPMGWLNDANGMWYDQGLYHLSYQAFPYELGGDAKHWGHASSPDLVHWTHWPIMLDPGVNVPGDAWSGSTVVDNDNTSGFLNGEGPVLVTLYTCTSKGTCVAYSNDHGMTWQAYDKNPVAIGGPNADTRDPHAFWYAPGSKWVVALFEDEGGDPGGISFYNSTDLKNWSKVSHIDEGFFECPDIYELPIDGDANQKKWVVQDAGGGYLLGSFDGTKFTPDGNGKQLMDTSGDFYASQTFNRRSLPDDRVIQMTWIRGMDGATAPWNQAIGFPLQVQLKTYPDGVHVARTPVAEVEKLYTMSQHIDASVANGSNPFAQLSSKVFDLSIDLDLSKTTAKTVTLQVGDLPIVLDVSGHKLYDRTASAINGHTKLRVLRDWGQFEVFANDGQVVHTQAHPFPANDDSISLSGDGAIGIASADFHALGRAWPGDAAKSSQIIDDSDGATAYSGTWTSAPESRYFKSSARVGKTANDSFEVPFSGTRFEWYGLKNTDLGIADVYLDGTKLDSVDCYSARRQNSLLYTKGKLTNGAHTLKVVIAGQKSAASSGTALVHDYVVAYVD